MIHVLKIGGGAGIDPTPVLSNLTRRVQNGERWILVHGCSARADALAAAEGYAVQTITSPGGHVSRHTDSRMIALFERAASEINAEIVAGLGRFGLPAMGFVGQNILPARRKNAIRAIREGRPVVIRDDYSGALTGVDVAALREALSEGWLPVVAPLGTGEAGEALNVDGDLAAAHIASALNAETLIILSNVPGLLRDVAEPDSLIREFGLSELPAYANFAGGRMKKKLLAAEQAAVPYTILGDARLPYPLDAALNGAGTHIRREGAWIR